MDHDFWDDNVGSSDDTRRWSNRDAFDNVVSLPLGQESWSGERPNVPGRGCSCAPHYGSTAAIEPPVVAVPSQADRDAFIQMASDSVSRILAR